MSAPAGHTVWLSVGDGEAEAVEAGTAPGVQTGVPAGTGEGGQRAGDVGCDLDPEGVGGVREHVPLAGEPDPDTPPR